jgi:hypothetical protein
MQEFPSDEQVRLYFALVDPLGILAVWAKFFDAHAWKTLEVAKPFLEFPAKLASSHASAWTAQKDT